MASPTGEPTFLEMLRNVVVTYKGTTGNPISIADVSKIARVEPITLISSSLTGTKELQNILYGILNIYAAYYLQAVQILSAQLSDVRILKILDQTNPDRDLKTLLASNSTAYESLSIQVPAQSLSEQREAFKTMTLENAQFKLPFMSKTNSMFATESIFDGEEDQAMSSSVNRLETFEKLGTAIGKVLEVKFTVRGEDKKISDEVTVTVVVKLDNMIIPSDVINNITTSNADEIRFSSRLRDALSGRISFIKDFILCSDLINKQKKTMIKDPTGYYAESLRRLNNSRFYSAISGNISLAGVSSIVVISEEDEQEIKRHIGGSLTNATTRKIVFDNISAMMIVVVDRSWERVTIYIRDINSFSQNSFDSFKSHVDKQNNIQDMIKAFSVNQPPTF